MLDRLRARSWTKVALFAAAAVLLLAWVQAPASGLYGYDGPFHIRYAERLRSDLAADGSFSQTFPWWQETFLKNAWADKDLLYHLLLIPFSFGDLTAGGKIASILFGAGLFTSIFIALGWLRVERAALWAAIAMIGSTSFLYRAGLLRSHVLAIALAVLGTAAILSNRQVATATIAFLYALSHIGWHLLPGIALIHDLIRCGGRRKWNAGGTIAATGGTLAAILISPYFPANLKLWWVQNAGVLTRSWSGSADDLGLGLEILPGRPADLIFYNLGPAILMVLGFAMLVRMWRRRDAGEAVLTLAVISIIFLLMSLLSRRFVEFLAPFSVLFAATALAPAIARPRRVGVGILAALVTLGVGAHNLLQARRIITEDSGSLFAGCAAYLRDHAPAGSTIFTTDWDEFPELFFVAPDLNYLVGLEPTFMYVTDPTRWRLWREVAEGRSPSLVEPISSTFKARFVFADAGYEAFIERVRQDPLMAPLYAEPDCSVFETREEPANRGLPFTATWRRQGTPREVRTRAAEFVDPGTLELGECVEMTGSISVTGLQGSAIGLAFSTDDTLEVRMDGRVILDTRVMPPLTLDDILAEHRTGGRFGLERRAQATPTGDSFTLAIRTCRAGRVPGFNLRLLPASGPGA